MAANGNTPRKEQLHTSEFHPFEGEHSDRHPEPERKLKEPDTNPTLSSERNELPHAGPAKGVVFMKGLDRPEVAQVIEPIGDTSCKAPTSPPSQTAIDTSASVDRKHAPTAGTEAHHSEAENGSHEAKPSLQRLEWSQRPRVFFHPSELVPPATSTTQSNIPRERVFFPPPRPSAPVVITAPVSSSTSTTSPPTPPPTPPLTPPPTPPLEEMQSEVYQNEAEYLSESSDEEDLYESGDGGFPVLDPYYFESDDEKFFGYSRDAEDDDYFADDEDSFAQH